MLYLLCFFWFLNLIFYLCFVYFIFKSDAIHNRMILFQFCTVLFSMSDILFLLFIQFNN